MKKLGLLTIITLIIISSSVFVFAQDEDHVIVNSQDWQDVYSSILYAKLEGVGSHFLTSTRHGRIVLNMVEKDKKVFLVSSRETPFVVGYRATVLSDGFDDVEEIISRDINLDLAERLVGINNYVVIDDDYGYNAISVASYAVVSNSYVLFANERNIDDVVDFLSTKNVNNILLYGNLDREVKDGLGVYSPEVINEGDRFDNNLEIVDKYLAINTDSKQTLMSNGEFIEDSIMSGVDPVIFIGKVNVPDQVREYIKKSPFQVAILIGNELIGAAQFIRQQIGIPVFVKFAQGARTPSGSISQVEDLDRFPMPRYNLLLGIYEIRYNSATRQLEVTFENRVNLATYFLSTITISTATDEFIVGDEDVVFIDKGGYKTIVYDVDLGGEENDLSAYVYTLFGESKKSLENVFEGNFNISSVTILDDSSIEIISLVYDVGRNEFVVEIRNTGEVDVFVSPEIIDLFFNDEFYDYSLEEPVMIGVGKTEKIRIVVDDLTEEDIAENEFVRIAAYYGQRERALFKVVFAEFEFAYKKADYYIYILIGVLLLLLLLLEFSKKKCENCKHKNKRRAKRCAKCHHKLK
ncbi:hypothetical protein GOV05_03730 [Candidatus Woesearchaeota archaeon]|nr:hypothetical protein [Candidatus Woesearchaeota archaeon]